MACASIGRNCVGEKAHLFTKNCGGDWQDTGFSAGKQFCCKNGMEVSCSDDLLKKNTGLLGIVIYIMAIAIFYKGNKNVYVFRYV